MINTLIFDLDGTLLNTLDDLHASVCFALQQAGLPLVEKNDTRRFLGNGIKKLIYQSVNHVCPQADETLKAHVLDTFRTYYVEHSMDKTAPFEGILPMLHACKQRGLFTAIVCNKLDPAVKILHQHFFADCIDIAIGETPTIQRKPAPDMVHESIRQLSLLHATQILSSNSIYIGDSEVDIQTAQNSQLPCISVTWGFRDQDFLLQSGAKTLIHHPSELLHLI